LQNSKEDNGIHEPDPDIDEPIDEPITSAQHKNIQPSNEITQTSPKAHEQKDMDTDQLALEGVPIDV